MVWKNTIQFVGSNPILIVKEIGPKYTGSKYRVTPLTPIRDDETLRIVSVGTVGNSGGDLKVVNS